MVKKTFLIISGLALITAGIAGIATSLVDQRNSVALRQVEEIQAKHKAAAAEEEKRLEERRQELDRIAMDVAEKEKRIEEERRRQDDVRRSREAAPKLPGKEALSRDVVRNQRAAKNNPPTGSDERNFAHMKKSGAKKSTSPGKEDFDRPLAGSDARPDKRAEEIKRISREAALEAARLSEPVKYRNRETHEIVLAEPLDYGSSYVRIRVRVWRNEILVKDMIVNCPESPSYEPARYKSLGAMNVDKNYHGSL
ncbi:MAG: hypothetical protein AB2L11_09360 [Syntrophobacteraceae bacterium]